MTWKISFLLLILFSLPSPGSGQVSFTAGSGFSYLRSSDASGLPSSWMDPGFDDSSWETGIAPFHYGDGTGGTELPDMRYSYSGLFLRTVFTAGNAELVNELIINVNYDDGFILYLNGEQIYSILAPDSPVYSSFATANHESGSFEEYIISLPPGLLKEGSNTLAVHGLNVSLESSDFYFDISLSATPGLPQYPDSSAIVFSHPSGYYEHAFSLIAGHPDQDVSILYTLDGSNPQDSPTTISLLPGNTILIDPESSSGRPLTPAVILRASVISDGYRASNPVSRTFIFLDKVKNQSYPGGGWPSYNVNEQVIDLDMDSRIINHPVYSNMVDESFLDLPAISLVTDIDNLFDTNTGIYVNALNHGENWERECSVELIDPDGTEGFMVNAGLRIRGGYSRNSQFRKHAFRLLFKDVYGAPKLRFPLFGEEGTDRYDNIDLRTSQNYAWANGGSANTMVREVYARDTQGEMGHPYTRSRYYHLYLNGMYWGLYQTQERSEASFASDYLGGEEENYDVIKVNTIDGAYDVEATDGDLAGWRRIWNTITVGVTANSRYFSLVGKDAEGNTVPGAETLVDMDNLIDYMLIIFYTGSFDSPVSSFLNNSQPNNFYAINNREYRAEGFRFFCHDTEHSMFSVAHSPGIGLYEDRVNLARQQNSPMIVSGFNDFHPHWLHEKLAKNAEYRQLFIDRAYLHLGNGGILGYARNLERIEKRIEQISMAMIAESARWGDASTWNGEPYTRNDTWIPELNRLKSDFLPYRTNILIDQLKSAGLYTETEPPVFRENSVFIPGNSMEFTGNTGIEIYNPEPDAVLYYSLEGIDPRKVGGQPDESAFVLEGNSQLFPVGSSMHIKARNFRNGEWSALKDMKILKIDEDLSPLKITELHFFPPDSVNGNDTIEGKRFEFIEFKNVSDHALNLSGLHIDSAVEYVFPDKTLLLAGGFYVIAAKPSIFYNKYGMRPSGNYTGFLENDGEEFFLRDREGNELIRFYFTSEYPWPESASGTGKSLVSVEKNPTANPVEGWYWIASKNYGGSPFSDEPFYTGPPGREEIRTETKIYPNPAFDYVLIRFADNNGNTEKEIEIYTIGGKLLFRTAAFGDSRIELSEGQFGNGIYIMKISDKDRVKSFRLVINR